LEEDLLALGEKIRALGEAADEADAAALRQAKKSPHETGNAPATAVPEPLPTKQANIRASKVSEDGQKWSKKLLGAISLGGLGLAWAAGSYVDCL
jgi:hypothetical protein